MRLFFILIVLKLTIGITECDLFFKAKSSTSTSTITYPFVSLNCDFERDFCNWNNYTSSSKKFFWQRNQANELLDINGPLPDHTLQSLNGHYIYIQSNPSRLPNETTSIRSAPLSIQNSSTSYCFSFWYHMYGKAINTLNIKLENITSNKSSTIWSKQTSQGNNWRLAQLNLMVKYGNYRFIIEGKVGGNLLGDIAIDDISVDLGSCITQKFCDFDSSDICGFINSPFGVFNWTRQKGSTNTTNNGPSFDHTTFTANGYYLYIESSYPRKEFDNAILISPPYRYNSAGTKCVQLWYNAYGNNVGSLNVYKFEKLGVQGKYESLFSISGDQGNEWHVAQINFYIKSFQEFNILIEGVVGDNGKHDHIKSGGKGGISIDDYELRDKECQPMGDCDFEEDMCAWKNAERDANFEWVRNRGATPSIFSGPSEDHTLGTELGTYLFIETSFQSNPESKALLVSPVFDNLTPKCFEFYYHMKGSSSALNIIKKSFRSNTNGTVIWTDSSSDKDEWQIALVSLPNNFSSNYILIIEGKINGKNSGDIAIDDLKIISGNICPKPESICVFQCDNGTCLNEKKICNFIDDCSNGEDEKDCGYQNVNFELGTSNWNETSGSSMLKWIRKNNGIGNEPQTDHTLGTSSGFYIMLNSSSSGTSSKNAQFSSPIMRDSSSNCQMEFWHQINGKNVGGIEVNINIGLQKSRVLKLEEETYGEWVLKKVYIGRYQAAFQINIEGYRNIKTFGSIAFDDISFWDCGIIVKNLTCEFDQLKCDNKNCVSISRLCDFSDDCGDMSDEKNQTCIGYPFRCTFENNFCDWVPSEQNEYNWKRTTAFYALPKLAPQRDHTTNTASGSYIYVDTTEKTPSSTSVLFGPLISTGSQGCKMRFFYFMSGSSVGKLSISYRTAIDGSFTNQWNKLGPLGDYWERGEVYFNVDKFYKNYQIVIESQVSSVNSNQHGIIAIDDISFTQECIRSIETLPVTYTTSPPPLCGFNGFRCSSGECISNRQICDFINDCQNGEDELNCGDCDFEKDSCGWYDNSFGGHIFNRTTALDAQISKDVSSGLSNGSLINYEIAEGAFSGFSRLYSPTFGSTSSFCEFEFYYYKNDPNSIEFSLFLVDSVNRIERLWRTRGNSPNNDWNRVSIGLHSRDAGFKLYFESSFNHLSNQKTLLAIDETKFKNCQTQFNVSCLAQNVFQCEDSYCIPNNFLCDYSKECSDFSDESDAKCINYTRCDFENELNSLCQWTNDNDADLKWKRAVAKQYLELNLSYPTFDHTTLGSEGHYYHNDYNGKPNRISRLSSPVIYPVSANCSLRLWYYITNKGENNPGLRIYMRTIYGGPLNLIWQKENINILDWVRTDIELKSEVNFQLVIEATNGNTEIAIDDISLTPSCKINTVDQLPSYIFTTPKPDPTCPALNQIRCRISSECIFVQDLCNFKYDCNDKTDEETCPWLCNFENNDFCHWINEIKDSDESLNIKWEITTASRFNKNYGPQFDHSLLSPDGKFLFFDSIGEIQGNKARLISPVYNQIGQTCSLEFWYQLYGSQTSILNVYIKSNLIETLIGTVTQIEKNQWTLFKIDLPTCLNQFQIVLEGIRGPSNTSYIFVDDLRLNNCEYPKETNECKIDEFKCTSFNCVPKINICDMGGDCCDHSDESDDVCLAYYRCNFETTMCGFKNTNETNLNWFITRSDSDVDFYKPFYDHTTQTSKGHYLKISKSLDSRPGESAYLGITLKSSLLGCKLRIWHQIKGENSVFFAVWIRKEIGGELTSLYSTNEENFFWKRIDVDIPHLTNFQLLLEGTTSNLGSLAIDDISFTPECSIDQDIQLPTFTTEFLNSTTEEILEESTSQSLNIKEKEKSSSDLKLAMGIGVPCLLVIFGIMYGIYWHIVKRKKSNSSLISMDFSTLNKNLSGDEN